MRDVYVLQHKDSGLIFMIADDIELCNIQMAAYTAIEQAHMTIQNYDLWEAD